MRSTDGSNDDVCLLTLLFEILGMGVTDGNSTITILLLHHELGHGLSDDVTSPEHDTLLSRCLYIVMAQQRSIPNGVAETKHGKPIDMRPTLMG